MISKEPDFKIVADDVISNEFRLRSISTFQSAAQFVRNLKYGRNSDKSNLATVFSDDCGTCSTKHAILKTLADENGFSYLELKLGIFRMNPVNTPKIAQTLSTAGLDYIPEAHNYLRHNGHILDYTTKSSDAGDFESDLIEETTIAPGQIDTYKIGYHKRYLENWIDSEPGIKYSLDDLWTIREHCIAALSL